MNKETGRGIVIVVHGLVRTRIVSSETYIRQDECSDAPDEKGAEDGCVFLGAFVLSNSNNG
jgi:hypothetical protein